MWNAQHFDTSTLRTLLMKPLQLHLNSTAAPIRVLVTVQVAPSCRHTHPLLSHVNLDRWDLSFSRVFSLVVVNSFYQSVNLLQFLSYFDCVLHILKCTTLLRSVYLPSSLSYFGCVLHLLKYTKSIELH